MNTLQNYAAEYILLNMLLVTKYLFIYLFIIIIIRVYICTHEEEEEENENIKED